MDLLEICSCYSFIFVSALNYFESLFDQTGHKNRKLQTDLVLPIVTLIILAFLKESLLGFINNFNQSGPRRPSLNFATLILFSFKYFEINQELHPLMD